MKPSLFSAQALWAPRDRSFSRWRGRVFYALPCSPASGIMRDFYTFLARSEGAIMPSPVASIISRRVRLGALLTSSLE